ncbi:hypothetical protein Nepgr_014506 [Nepenthes gracilis]|uniref:Senescence regulator n=1 Tax=Nepenthes gracilis TaxID=150966 RepID=A0AAD3SJE2_NEPGR|nr:hypothetical protein Nepgr_014506 [Nepenthes gracilis]
MEDKAPFYRRRKPSSSDRFLSLFSHSPPSTASGDELSEGDVLWTGESAESSHHSSPPSTSSTPPLLQRHVNSKVFDGAMNFGVLAAVRDTGHDKNNHSVFNHKTSVSPSSSLSARMIPILPRPPVERSGGMSLKFQQSAPVSVPVMPSNGRTRRKGSGFDSQDDEDDEEESEMLPPHEIVARQSAKSPILSCSVLEGAGRTLKGRDLRQVRNAVFRKTGFID